MAKTKTDTATKGETAAADAPTTTKAKPTAAAATKAVKALLTPTGDIISNVSSNVENLNAKKALEILPQLFDSVDTTFFTIGGVLARVHEESWWKDAGFESFKEYIEEEHGLAYRTSMYWVQIYNDLVASEIEFEAVKDIGWSKLKEISSMLTPETAEEWIKRADEMSLKQLIEYIKAIKSGGSDDGGDDGGVDTNKSDVKSVTFKLHDDEKSSVDAAVATAMESLGTEYPSVAITNICDNYLQGEGGKGASATSLKDAMQAAGYEKVLEHFEELFPNLDLDVTVN